MVCNCSQPRKAHGTPCCALNERTDSGVTGLSNVGDMLVVNFVSLLAAPIYRDVQCLQLLNQTSEQTRLNGELALVNFQKNIINLDGKRNYDFPRFAEIKRRLDFYWTEMAMLSLSKGHRVNRMLK
ncbi:hypothetical protein T07_11210 [Trichinella nelsoni]|uniref:Uncharacterized protein n=1 Tax=Trichinella nelsoni TaxID=6336 RepID=A0A0V0RKL4_9BILA|nr:hypothetical protein T07_11210 [Trichinella nelsoni]